MKTIVLLIALLATCAGITKLTACSGESPTKIRVLCAGSLMVPFQELEREFEAKYPDIDVLIEGHGSIQVIRHVTEIHEEADVMAVADHSLIPMMMYNVKIPDKDDDYADWYIKFATNSLGIAYTPASKYAGEINEQNWYEIMSRPDVRVGFADARLDACGYRTLMLLNLAETYYRNDDITGGVLGEFNPAIAETTAGMVRTITIPEILNPVSERTILRGSSIRMLALLDSGDIDYTFEYRSVAEQHGLRFIELPPEINLGDAGYSAPYNRVKCLLDFHRFSSVQPEFEGQPIIYGITVPKNAPHPGEAEQFIEFLLSSEGSRILAQNHQPPLEPVEAENIDTVPAPLKQFLE
ncbi:MAG: tungstate ABC transporter substrate-binding protein WtpA [Dehalococcoidia bacterium]|jgi:molybdate/tungstate transport system substrate-binding protein